MARTQRGSINLLPTTGVGLNLRFYFPAFMHPPWRSLPLWHPTHRHPGHASHLGISTRPCRSVISHSQSLSRDGGLRAHEHLVFLILISLRTRRVNLPDGALARIAPNSICTGVLALRPNLSAGFASPADSPLHNRRRHSSPITTHTPIVQSRKDIRYRLSDNGGPEG